MLSPEFLKSRSPWIIVCLLQDDDLKTHMKELETIGNRNGVTLIVQPVPYEGLAFLTQLGGELLNHLSEEDGNILWCGLRLKEDLDATLIETIAVSYHEYLIAILNQDAKTVTTQLGRLQEYVEKYAA